jgi:outer membrane protein assembly factor BamB
MTNGNKLWGVLDPKGAAVSATTMPAVVGTSCYFATTEGYLSESKLRCVSIADGALLWQTPLAGVVDSSPAATADALLFGCHDGALHRASISGGRPIATVPLATKIFSSPALSGGRAFVGVQGGKLICLG